MRTTLMAAIGAALLAAGWLSIVHAEQSQCTPQRFAQVIDNPKETRPVSPGQQTKEPPRSNLPVGNIVRPDSLDICCPDLPCCRKKSN
jgi:hypothetical protein